MSTKHRPMRLATAAATLCGLWVLFAGADPAGWVLGVPAVVLALAGIVFLPPAEATLPRPLALARLAGFFVVETVRGAADVGARALTREPAARASVVRWTTRLATPTARLVLVHGISLVPGTLTARLEGDVLHVHVLDRDAPWREGLAALEGRIASAFEPGPEPA